jgi:hypothetical protein
MVEETFFSSVRPGNGECTQLAQKIKQGKNEKCRWKCSMKKSPKD